MSQELKPISIKELNKNNIQIYSCLLDQSELALSGIYSGLSIEEINRSEKLKFTKLRKRWVLSRGILRLLLSTYYDCSPKEIEFIFNEFNKPLLSKDFGGNVEISFNLSHSNNIAVYIFTQDRRIGIDLEKTEELSDLEGLADLCFSEYEKKWFNNLPLAKRKELFYRIWTCKEAYIKAIGKGFSFPPNKITLDLNPNKQLYFQEIIGDNNVGGWKVVEFRTHPDYVSSAVIEGDDFTIQHFHLNLNNNKEQMLEFSAGVINCSIESINFSK